MAPIVQPQRDPVAAGGGQLCEQGRIDQRFRLGGRHAGDGGMRGTGTLATASRQQRIQPGHHTCGRRVHAAHRRRGGAQGDCHSQRLVFFE